VTTDFIGRGWSYPVHAAPGGGIATVEGIANVEKAMRIVLMTQLGERPMRPGFGSTLRQFLFEPMTPENEAAIAREVRRALHSCEPRVQVQDVDVSPDPGGAARYDIEIAYTVLRSTDRFNLVVPFYSIPGEEE
jgi:phage baseplate assembly protein W